MWVFKPNSGGQVLKNRRKIALFPTLWIIHINRLVCLDSSPKKWTKVLQLIGRPIRCPCAKEALTKATRKLFWAANHYQMNAGGDWSWRCDEVWFATLFLHLCFLDDKRGVGWLWFTGLWILYSNLFLTLREDSKPLCNWVETANTTYIPWGIILTINLITRAEEAWWFATFCWAT